MPYADFPSSSVQSSRSVLRVLEILARASGVTFNRILAERVLGESARSTGGEDAQSWARRLVEVGESMNLRIRTVDCSFAESLAFVRKGVPTAVLCDPESSADGNQPPSETRWLVLVGTKGRRIRVLVPGPDEREVLMSARQLRQAIGRPAVATRGPWIIGQPAFECQPPAQSPVRNSHEPLSPLARLLGLLRPEKRDLWVVFVFSVIVGILALATPVAVEALVNTVAFGRYLQPIIILSLLLFTFLAFAAAMRALTSYVVEIFQRRMFIRVLEDLAYRLPRVQQEQFDGQHGPELVNRFFDVVTVQKAAASLLLDGLAIVLQTVIGMGVLAFYHPFLLGFDVVLLALVGFIVFGLGRNGVKTAIKESKAKYAAASWLEELSRHPTAFKLHGGSQFALNRADQLAVEWLACRRAHFRVVIRQILFALSLQALAATALLGLGGWLVVLGELTLGQLVAAELIVMVIVGSFTKLGKHLDSFYDLMASVDKLGQLFDLQVEAHDKLFHLQPSSPASVRLSEVSYRYPGSTGLTECDLELAPGEKVAIVGAPGCGKSTLVDLLCGMRAPSSGHIELDGIDLRELRPDSLREHLAVARSIEIFHGTIDENVHLNRPQVQANDVRDALNAVGLLDELLKLPNGLNSVVQTGGSPLSESQARRLMLARAVVSRPRLLLIDGTLDGLSDEVLGEVLPHLMDAKAPWTLLVTTGRRSVVDACDRVIRLDESGIVRDRETLVN